MPEFVNHCPLCGSERSRLFDQRLAQGSQVSNQLCRNCGLVYQSPRMTAAEANEFYAAAYRRLYQGDEDPIRKDLAVQDLRAASLLDFIRPYVGSVDRHLDIGCSAGALLQATRSAYHSQPVGVEPGMAYRTYARGQGLTVYASLDELRQNDDGAFDLVSLSHVLEHLPNPVAYLSDLSTSLLVPGGWLLLEVPNLYAHDCFEVAHLFSFTAATLGNVVGRAGYEIIHQENHGRPYSQWIPFYVTLLARLRPDTGSIHPLRLERLVGLKRRLGLWRRALLARLFPKKTWRAIS